MKTKPFKYRFFLEVPRWVNITDKVFDLGKQFDVDLEFLAEEGGVLRKTVFFMARGASRDVIHEFSNAISNMDNDE